MSQIKSSSQEVKQVVIVGGGTAGWMTAASLAKYFQGRSAKILVIESSEIGTVGVGEATIPNIIDFNNRLGINEIDFIKSTQASFKLGIQFENWSTPGSEFFHPFADYGMKIDNVDFHHYINRANTEGFNLKLQNYCFANVLAKHGKFAQPHPNPSTPIANYSYAYHFDAGLYANYLKTFSLKLGVQHIDAKVSKVNLRTSDGFIESLELENGETIAGDLFVDCSGFKGLLIEEALQTGYESWQQWLFCDRAVAIQTRSTDEPTPFTRSIAHENGWQWRIPLQHRVGNGYIYSSKYESDSSAESRLLTSIEGETINRPRHFSFHPGRRKQIWNKNCIAIGLSSGFLEPLESTSISLIQSAIAKLLTFFPDMSFDPADIAEVNRLHNSEVEHVRDFLILHYKLSKRTDSEFWRDCQSMEIPETLSHKIDLFKSRGHIISHENESFEPASWLTMYDAFGIVPKRYDPRANLPALDMITTNLQKMKDSLDNAALQVLSHQSFIDKHCKSEMP
ncbi:tryptophan 7-halogenase [Thalassotalea litorea]|uniref:Tryptophan 7-halogenase n=1 Tax=Thalassotalea litorea TaxID=2020715 RepID=A0A5R9ISV8_9GAMM|nr:tryptophan halogenase family protein [Thalassotalea litorea]TLU67137.1 tryptophan 7-halogenase [Thalassotalea litorea]